MSTLAELDTRHALVSRRRARQPAMTAMSVLSLLPFIAVSALLLAYPFWQVVRMSLSNVTLTSHGFHFTWAGATNFRTLWQSPQAADAILRTAEFTAMTVVGSLIVGILGALLVNRAVVLLPIARNVLIWPAVITPVVVSVLWLLILNPTAGGLNKVLTSLGIPTQAWLNTGRGAMGSLVVVDLWHWSPVVFLFVYTALQAISEDMLEAARLDGATERQILRHVTMPLLVPAIATVAVVRSVMGIRVFDEMYVLTSGGPNGATTLVSQQVQLWFFQALKFGQAAAFSIVVVVGTAALLGCALVFRARLVRQS